MAGWNICQECIGCSKRQVGCHNIQTCPAWAEHEAAKPAMYAARATCAALAGTGVNAINRFKKQSLKDVKRGRSRA